jgi:hypothetical protein
VANDIAAQSGDTALVSARATENAGARLNFTDGTAGFVTPPHSPVGVKECWDLAAYFVSRAPQTGREPTKHVQAAGNIPVPDEFRPYGANTIRSRLSAPTFDCVLDVDVIYSGVLPSRENAWREVDQ